MTALSCNLIPLGFCCQPLTQHDPGIYGNCLVALRFLIYIILPPGLSELRPLSKGQR